MQSVHWDASCPGQKYSDYVFKGVAILVVLSLPALKVPGTLVVISPRVVFLMGRDQVVMANSLNSSVSLRDPFFIINSSLAECLEVGSTLLKLLRGGSPPTETASV